jgi:hypothetical protein
MQLAYQHPEICERLVLVGSGGLDREVSWILRALTRFLAREEQAGCTSDAAIQLAELFS